MIRRTKGERLFDGINLILLAGFAFLAVYPFLYTLSLSLSTQAEAGRAGLHLAPGNPAHLWRAARSLMSRQWQPPPWPTRPEGIRAERVSELICSIGRSPTDPVGRYLRGRLPDELVRRCAAYAKSAALDPVPGELIRAVLEEIESRVLACRENPLVLRPGESPFEIEDLADPAAIVISLRNRAKPHERFLHDRMDPADRAVMARYEPPDARNRIVAPDEIPLEVRQALVRSLNRAAEMFGDIYSPDRFRFVSFMPVDLRRSLSGPVHGRRAVARNRRLIQAMYGRAIWKLDERRFHGVPVAALGRGLARRPELTQTEFALMNRLHLMSAYPGVFRHELGARGHLSEFAGGVTLTSYAMVLRNRDVYVGYANTVFRTVVATLLTVLLTAIAAFPLARKDLPHRGVMIVLLLVTMLFSGGLIPGFLLIRNLGLYNSRWVYILPGLLTAFNIILVRNFFQSVPESLYESAMVDGANDWHILFRIYLPLSKPVLATIALWTAVVHWNEWFTPLVFIDDAGKQVLQFFLQKIVINNQTYLIERGLVEPDVAAFAPETIKAAMVLVTMIPILGVYPFAQKYFVKGVMLGSLKE